MKQAIKSFNQDEYGDWVAELACGHSQHMRHDPPWQERPWVLLEQGRERMIGVEVECTVCNSMPGASSV